MGTERREEMEKQSGRKGLREEMTVLKKEGDGLRKAAHVHVCV